MLVVLLHASPARTATLVTAGTPAHPAVRPPLVYLLCDALLLAPAASHAGIDSTFGTLVGACRLRVARLVGALVAVLTPACLPNTAAREGGSSGDGSTARQNQPRTARTYPSPYIARTPSDSNGNEDASDNDDQSAAEEGDAEADVVVSVCSDAVAASVREACGFATTTPPTGRGCLAAATVPLDAVSVLDGPRAPSGLLLVPTGARGISPVMPSPPSSQAAHAGSLPPALAAVFAEDAATAASGAATSWSPALRALLRQTRALTDAIMAAAPADTTTACVAGREDAGEEGDNPWSPPLPTMMRGRAGEAAAHREVEAPPLGAVLASTLWRLARDLLEQSPSSASPLQRLPASRRTPRPTASDPSGAKAGRTTPPPRTEPHAAPLHMILVTLQQLMLRSRSAQAALACSATPLSEPVPPAPAGPEHDSTPGDAVSTLLGITFGPTASDGGDLVGCLLDALQQPLPNEGQETTISAAAAESPRGGGSHRAPDALPHALALALLQALLAGAPASVAHLAVARRLCPALSDLWTRCERLSHAAASGALAPPPSTPAGGPSTAAAAATGRAGAGIHPIRARPEGESPSALSFRSLASAPTAGAVPPARGPSRPPMSAARLGGGSAGRGRWRSGLVRGTGPRGPPPPQPPPQARLPGTTSAAATTTGATVYVTTTTAAQVSTTITAPTVATTTDVEGMGGTPGNGRPSDGNDQKSRTLSRSPLVSAGEAGGAACEETAARLQGLIVEIAVVLMACDSLSQVSWMWRQRVCMVR